jgi:hypothetical protein
MEDVDALVEHLERSSCLSRGEAERVVADVVAFFSEAPDAFVVRRHGELKATGFSNSAIFAAIAAELDGRRFRAPPLSERQIRRLIYG